jgi:hypothetical protein
LDKGDELDKETQDKLDQDFNTIFGENKDQFNQEIQELQDKLEQELQDIFSNLFFFNLFLLVLLIIFIFFTPLFYKN